jgi:hypothetical protein
MPTPYLHLQLFEQLRQWILPLDQRHLKVFAEIMAAMLQSQSACLSRWIPLLGHRDCNARSHMERLSYFVHNPRIVAETFYVPLLKHFLEAFAGLPLELTLDTSMLWDQFCLVEVCVIWGGRSIPLSQVVLEHGSATVGFEDYYPVLEAALALVPEGSSVSLLADRGFLHGELIRWARRNGWSWAIRGKVDTQITFASGITKSAQELCPPAEEAYLFRNITVFEDITCHLATANVPAANEDWIVLSDCLPSVQTFALYGRRFGGIEPHFKDYKSAAFHVLDTHLRDAQALTCLVMIVDCATLLAIVLGMIVVRMGQRVRLDWHPQRGLSFLQLGLRELQRLLHCGERLPPLEQLPPRSPPTAFASNRNREELECRIEFSRVTALAF